MMEESLSVRGCEMMGSRKNKDERCRMEEDTCIYTTGVRDVAREVRRCGIFFSFRMTGLDW